jgi:nitroreductase
MEFFDLVKKRRSVRKYRSEAVRREDIMRILDAANYAPSAMNSQPWEFMVVTGGKIMELGQFYGAGIREMSERMKAAGQQPPFSGDDYIEKASRFGGAPVLVLVLAEKRNNAGEMKAWLESACAAIQNIILAATDMGLGTCWMTGPLREETAIRKILGIGDEREIVALTPLGYPDEDRR